VPTRTCSRHEQRNTQDANSTQVWHLHDREKARLLTEISGDAEVAQMMEAEKRDREEIGVAIEK